MRPLRASLVSILAGAVVSSCVPGGRPARAPVEVRKGGRLDAKGIAAVPTDGPFRVGFLGPDGDELETPQPQIVFTRPVRAFGQKPGEPKLDAVFQPPVEGRWEWMGTRAARFVATAGFAAGTTYTLEVAPGAVRSMDGETLASPARTTFATRRPAVTWTSLRDGETEVPLDARIGVQFDRTIPKTSLEQGITIVDRGGKSVPFDLEPAGDRWNQGVELRPKPRWPEGERLTVKVAGGLRGSTGDLGTRPRDLSFDTRSPLHVVAIECTAHEDGRCRARADIEIRLSAEMRPSDLFPLLRASAKLKRPDAQWDEPSTYHHFELVDEVAPGTPVVVEVVPSNARPRPLPRPRGASASDVLELRSLAVGLKTQIVYAPTDPSVKFSFSGTYVPLSDAEIAARAEDTATARAGTVRLDRDAVMKLEGEPKTPWWDLAGATQLALPARQGPKSPPAWTSLASMTPALGPVLFGARWEGVVGEAKTTAVLQRSDLALYARVSPEGTLAWVTSLRTGNPIEGANVEARDPFGRSITGVTGADGVVMLATPGMGRPPEETAETRDRSRQHDWLVLFVQRGEDWIYRRIDNAKPVRPRGALFTDRGLYRPGEIASLKGVVRLPTSQGLVPVTGKDAKLEITDPAGQVSHAVLPLGAFGTYHHTIELPADGPLGGFHVVTSVDGERVGDQRFEVRQYRPSSFSVEASLDKKSYTRGERVTCTGRGAYLYGGSLRGSNGAATFSRQQFAYQVPGLVGFTIQDSAQGEPLSVAGGERTAILDAGGVGTFAATLDNANQRGPEMITCDVTMRDASMDLFGGSADAVVHPGDVYVALENTRWGQLHGGQTFRPKVLAVTPEGARKAVPVRLELWQHKNDPKKGASAAQGAVVASCELTTAAEPATCTLTVPGNILEDTAYFVVRASTKDPHGPVSASVTMYPGRVPTASPVAKQKKAVKARPEAKAHADKERYVRGEQARVTVQSPFAQAHALFTVEREGFLSHEVRAVDDEPQEVRVPIGEAAAPFVTTTATYVSPYADGTHHTRSMSAATKLATGWTEHALSLAIRPSKSQATPGEELDVEVDVHLADGTPADAEVTLYAADEATLQLAHYRIPDVLDSFFVGREHLVTATHTRASLGSLFDWQAELRAYAHGFVPGQGFGTGHGRLGGSHTTKPPQLRMGATSVGTTRRNFDQTAFFLPTLRTDASGTARVHVRLPEALTTYRFMAFAVTKGSDFGATETPVMTSLPLQVRPVMPRVIRVGDTFSMGVMAANNGGRSVDAAITVEAAGLASAGPLVKRTSLAAGGSSKVSFELEARQVGKGTVKVAIDGGASLADSAELPFVVEPALSVETASVYGVAEDAQIDERLGDLSAVRADIGGMELSVSTSPVTGLGAGLEQLVTYPYGCTEQTTSRLVPLLSLRELARALAVELPADLDDASRSAVARLLGNQKRDGGFGLWSTSANSSPWLSTYATWGLEEARRHGVPVDEKALERARAYLAGLLLSWGAEPERRASAAFALDVLVDAGGADAASLTVIAAQLFGVRDGMPLFSRALLLHAMGKLGSDRGDVETLTRELAAGIHLEGPMARYVGSDDAYALLLDSSVRTSALVLRALLSVSPQHPLAEPLALGLVADRRGSTWRTTQETAWALLALDDYRRARPASANASADVLLGGTQLFHHAFEGAPAGTLAPDARGSIPIATLLGAGGRELSFVGHGRVHYEARLRYYPRELPVDDVAAGIEIHRRYSVMPTQLDAEARKEERWRSDTSTFDEGALILIELEVSTASPRRFVVVDDPLPGGFESYDVRMQGGPSWLMQLSRTQFGTRSEKRDDRAVFFFDELSPGTRRISHLVRATAKGSFVAPPAKVEEMYAPENYGRTGARRVAVK